MTIHTIYFDFDSTLSAIEGIDELGGFASEQTRDRLVELTRRAMEGELPLDEVYPKRLDLIRPDAEQVAKLADLYIERIVPGAAEVVTKLLGLGKQVGVISGGIRQAVLPLALRLGISSEQVHAVELHFSEKGGYTGFDRTSPLWRSGGKRVLIESLREEGRTVCMVGDGVNDLETKDSVDLFVGFGGVACREVVESRAEHFIPGPGLDSLLEIVLDESERDTLQVRPGAE